MPDVNKANRQVCDVQFFDYSNKKPFLNFDTANTTTAGLSGESVYAMAKGSKRISFPNPLDGTFSITAQVYPFKFFSIYSNGVVGEEAEYAKITEVTAAAASSLVIDETASDISNVYVSADGETWVAADAAADTDTKKTKITVKTGSSVTIEKDKTYKVSYFIKKSTGVKKVAFSNKNLPKDYYVVMSTLDKDEDGYFTPFKMVVYKATVQRNFELSFNSEGDPAEVTATFDILEDKDGNVLDFIEIEDAKSTDSVEASKA